MIHGLNFHTVQDSVASTVQQFALNGGASYRYSFMIFSSSVHYVTVDNGIADRPQIYTSEEILAQDVEWKNNIRYLGEGVNMDLALRRSREHFEQNIVDGEEVRFFVKYVIHCIQLII